MQLSGHTNASFNDIEKTTTSISICPDFENTDKNCKPITTTWDKSSMDFDGSVTTGTCGKVSTTITNSGDKANSTSDWYYELYRVVKSKTPIGEPLASGKVEIIESMKAGEIVNESQDITNDKYQFKVKRPVGHKAKNNIENGNTYIWSDVIKVEDCSSVPATEEIDKNELDNSEPVKEQVQEDIKDTEKTPLQEVSDDSKEKLPLQETLKHNEPEVNGVNPEITNGSSKQEKKQENQKNDLDKKEPQDIKQESNKEEIESSTTNSNTSSNNLSSEMEENNNEKTSKDN